jgi:hypothetical protein
MAAPEAVIYAVKRGVCLARAEDAIRGTAA